MKGSIIPENRRLVLVGSYFWYWQTYVESVLCLCVCAASLKPELFEGMRFDFIKGLNQKFSLSHRLYRPFLNMVLFSLVFTLSLFEI